MQAFSPGRTAAGGSPQSAGKCSWGPTESLWTRIPLVATEVELGSRSRRRFAANSQVLQIPYFLRFNSLLGRRKCAAF